MDFSPLVTLAREMGCTVTADAPMAAATTFRVGGPADLLIDLPDNKAAAAVLRCCHENGIPYFWLGNGSNLLVGDRGIRGAVLRLDKGQEPRLTENGCIVAPAGMSLQRLCLFAREHSLTGLEFAYGIPGTVGGAVYMNAGAYDGQMADIVTEACCVTPTGEETRLTAEELAMTYRHTALMERGDIVLNVTLRLQTGEQEAIATRMKELMGRRQEKQPLEYPSAGSFFKRPAGYFAGALVEQTGLKGFTVGGAQVSEKHAGFVINRGGATAADIRRLCEEVQERVFAAHGVHLEPEVRFVGEF
ncbi:MAG: UDP-N-acetylmuramate dehydrogenase [Clostridia bacterium]|nr:UDP-N-acetylmuramate dehydrogenase [Clostridia bacterium]